MIIKTDKWQETNGAYFNYFKWRWIEAFALLHYFPMYGFVDLISYSWEAHDIVLNFYGKKSRSYVNFY